MLDFDNIPVDPALMSLHQAASASTSAQVGNATSSWNGKTTRANGRLATSMGMGMIDPSLWALQPDATGEKAKPAGRTVAGDEKMAASDSAPASAPASMTWMGGESHGTHGDGAEAEAGISLDAPQGGQYPQPDQHHDPVQNQGRESEHEQQEGAAAGAMVMSETEDYGQIEDTDVEIDPALREIVNSLTKAQEAQQAAAEPGALQEANPHSHPIADTDMITQQLDGGVVLDAEHMQLDELSAEHFAELLQNASAAYNDTDMPGMLLHDHDHLSLQSGEGHVDDGQIGVGIGVGVGVGIGLGAGAGMHSASHSHGHRTHRGQATHHPGSDTSHLPHNINGPLDAYTTHIASTSTSASGVSTPHSDQPHVGMEYMDGLHTHSPPVGASGDGATGVHADPFGATANAAMHDHIHTPVHGLGTGAVEYSAYDLPNGGSHFTPDTDTPPVPPKRGRGRPRGSKNKPRLRLAHPSQPSHIEFPYIPASSGHGLASSSTSSSLGFTLSTPLDPCSTSTSPSSSSFPAPAPPPAPAPGRTRPARPDPKPAGPIGRPPRVRTGEELEKWLAQRAAKAAGISRGRGRPRKFPGYLVREMRLVKNREEFKKVVAAAQAEQGGREGRDGREEPEEGVDADGWNGWSKRPEGKVRRDAEGGSGGRGEEGQEEGDGRDDRARKRRRMDNGSADAEAGPSGSAENFGQLEMDYGERQHRQHSIDNPHGYSGRREGDPGESSLHDHVHDHADPAELGTMAIDMHGNISLQEQDDWDWQQHGMNDHGGPDRLMDNHDHSLVAQHGHTPHGRTSISDRLSDPSGSGAPEYAGHGGGPGGNMDMEADIESHRLLEAVRDHFRSLPHSPAGV